MKWSWLAAAAILAAVLVAVAFAIGSGERGAGEAGQGLLVVTTMPALESEVKELLCPGDSVESIIPPGVDPHTYQLKPSDYDLLKKADLVVVLGGEPIADAVISKARELGVDTVVVLNLDGIRILKTPSGFTNVHYPIYDPGNYKIFVDVVSEKLAQLNPGQAGCYGERASRVKAKIDELLAYKSSLSNVKAVASTPLAQYATSWLGVSIEAYVSESPKGETVPSNLERIESLMKSGQVDVAFIVTDASGEPLTRADSWLQGKAGEYGVPVVKVPAPFTPGSTVEKLGKLLEELKSLGLLQGG
ncbi:metal ABC transporter substrate-binding protein [Stetteria hydrogenophila]